jgi:MFS family permease
MVVTRLGEGAARPAAAGAAVGVLGLALALPAVTTATAALALFLLLRSACNAAMSTVAYPLASLGAAEAGIGAGAAIGLVNAAWATSTVVAPLAGGAIAQAAGDRAAFAVLVPITLLTGAWLLAVDRPRAARALRRAARSHR